MRLAPPSRSRFHQSWRNGGTKLGAATLQIENSLCSPIARLGLAGPSLIGIPQVVGGRFCPGKEGGPIFFAENCFGNQLGFRWHDGRAIGYLLDVDTFEAFTAAETLAHLFDDVLINRYALTDPRLLAGVRDLLGTVPDDTHYAPLVSPLVGGRLVPQNYQLETANVHLRTSIATWEATRG